MQKGTEHYPLEAFCCSVVPGLGLSVQGDPAEVQFCVCVSERIRSHPAAGLLRCLQASCQRHGADTCTQRTLHHAPELRLSSDTRAEPKLSPSPFGSTVYEETSVKVFKFIKWVIFQESHSNFLNTDMFLHSYLTINWISCGADKTRGRHVGLWGTLSGFLKHLTVYRKNNYNTETHRQWKWW